MNPNDVLFFLQYVLLGVQLVIAFIGFIYGIALLVRKTRSYYDLAFLLGMWALGVVRVLPHEYRDPIVNQSSVIVSQICIVCMLVLYRKNRISGSSA